MSATTHAATAEELIRMPHDGYRYELVRGELRKMSPTGGRHGILVARLTTALGQYIEAHDLGLLFGAETGFKLSADPDTVRAPDVAFIRKERIPPGAFPETFWPMAPDLAIEVESPNDAYHESEEKIADYLAAGVGMVWIVSSKRGSVTIHRPDTEPRTLTGDERLEGGETIPGFHYGLDRLFAGTRAK
jgi:Uma2 family endonuclease